MKKMQVSLEKSNASVVYPMLTKVNNGVLNKNASKAFNKISEELIDEKVTTALRDLAEEITTLSTSEELDLYVQEKRQGGLGLPHSPKDFIRKLLSL
tara:strand:+ start:690 stop:980 length:291 start_codon:yes stop_codon:yes gene_type:complete